MIFDFTPERPRPCVVVTMDVFTKIEHSTTGRFRKKDEVTVSLFDAPLMRMVDLINRHQIDVYVWSFYDEALTETVAQMILTRRVEVAAIDMLPLEDAIFVLASSSHIQRVYDTNPERVKMYNRRGALVLPGDDFWTYSV